jgi:hypothetical protein
MADGLNNSTGDLIFISTQLLHIKMVSASAVRPAQEHVACSLHQVLAYDYTLPVVRVCAFAN